MKQNNSTISEINSNLFKQGIDLSSIKSSIYPKYKLIEGGSRVLAELKEGKFKTLEIHHISEEGVLCNDLETYIKWEMFS